LKFNGYWLELVEKSEKEMRERSGGDFS